MKNHRHRKAVLEFFFSSTVLGLFRTQFINKYELNYSKIINFVSLIFFPEIITKLSLFSRLTVVPVYFLIVSKSSEGSDSTTGTCDAGSSSGEAGDLENFNSIRTSNRLQIRKRRLGEDNLPDSLHQG